MEEHVILVDEKDTVLGTMPKMEAHLQNKLHRAFSVFIFNSNNELLIHQRAADKYHSANLWTNTCCSHQRPNEKNIDAAERRLAEEMGMRADNLTDKFHFIYQVSFDNELHEHELDHVLVGVSDEDPVPNPNEAQDYRWITLVNLEKEIEEKPNDFTFWFKKIIAEYGEKLLPDYESL